MRFVALITVLVAACNPSVDPAVEAAVVAAEKFAAEAVAGDCAALKAGSEAVFAAEGLKAIEIGSSLESRVKAAADKVKPLLDACIVPAVSDPIPVPEAPAEVQVAPDMEAPAEVVAE